LCETVDKCTVYPCLLVIAVSKDLNLLTAETAIAHTKLRRKRN